MITIQSYLCEESLFLYALILAKTLLQLGYSYFDNRLSFHVNLRKELSKLPREAKQGNQLSCFLKCAVEFS